jgi:hypothetical protein
VSAITEATAESVLVRLMNKRDGLGNATLNPQVLKCGMNMRRATIGLSWLPRTMGDRPSPLPRGPENFTARKS